MTILEYLQAVKELLLTNPLMVSFQIVRERMTSTDGYLRARIVLCNNSFLEFSEYVQLVAEDNIEVITYSYHWADVDGNLIVRWDNTPHFPELPGFPHHKHDGSTETVQAGKQMSIFKVVEEITYPLSDKKSAINFTSRDL